MKIVAIMGSPRGMRGFTAKLLNPLLAAAEEAGAKTEIFSLDTLAVQPCKGCLDVCHIQGKCQLKDDFSRILDSMLAADGIVFAVPNYMFGVTAQLKAVLDRCSLPLHCMRFYGKYAATVVTCGGSPPEDVEQYLNKILTQYALRIVGGVNGVELQFADPDENARLMKSAADLGPAVWLQPLSDMRSSLNRSSRSSRLLRSWLFWYRPNRLSGRLLLNIGK